MKTRKNYKLCSQMEEAISYPTTSAMRSHFYMLTNPSTEDHRMSEPHKGLGDQVQPLILLMRKLRPRAQERLMQVHVASW